MEPRNVVARGAVDGGKSSAQQDLVVGLQGQAVDKAADGGVQAGFQRAICVQPCHVVAGAAIERGEKPPGQYLAIGLHGQTENHVVGACARVEAGIQRAIQVQPCNAVSGCAIDAGEFPSNQHLAIGLHGQAIHTAIGAIAGVEAGVQRTIGVQPRHAVAGRAVDVGKKPCHQHLAIGLQRQTVDLPVGTGAGMKAGISRAVGVQPNNTGVCAAVEQREKPRHHHLAVWLQRQAEHAAIGTGAGVKAGVQRPIGVQSRNAVARAAIDVGEKPCDQHLAVWLHGQVVDPPINDRVEGSVDRAIGVQPGNAAARAAVERREVTPHQQLAVGLHGQAVDPVVGANAGVKAGIGRAIGMQPGNVAARGSVDRIERAPHHNLAVGLHRHADDPVVGIGVVGIDHRLRLRTAAQGQPQAQAEQAAQPQAGVVCRQALQAIGLSAHGKVTLKVECKVSVWTVAGFCVLVTGTSGTS